MTVWEEDSTLITNGDEGEESGERSDTITGAASKRMHW